jgi:hypothetical protein
MEPDTNTPLPTGIRLRRAAAVIVAVILLVAATVIGRKPAAPPPASLTPAASTDTTTRTLPAVTVTIDTGESVSTYSGIVADTALAALAKVASDRHLVLGTKTYDFGTLVEKIGHRTNTADRAWIVSVNGKSLETAADKASLHEGDSVEWAYKKPTY